MQCLLLAITVHATVSDGNINGTVELPNGDETTFTAPPATGVAGIYLIEDDKGIAANYSVINAKLMDSDSQNPLNTAATGNVKALDGTSIDFHGHVSKFGGSSNRSTWIVQSNGDIKGRDDDIGGGLYGSGSARGNPCSPWAQLKGRWFSVDCHAYMLPN